MSDHAGAADTMRERTGQSAAKLWFLVSADRIAVTAALGLISFLSFVAFVSVLAPPLIPQLESSSVIETLFSTMLSAVALVTTLTVTIGQVVLSQENGPIGDQHRRMSNAMDVRTYVGEIIGKPSPADPSTFLRELVLACRERADALRAILSGAEDEQLRQDVEDLVESITKNADGVANRLNGRSFGSFDVVSAALDFNYGRKIYEVEQILAAHADDLTEAERDRLAELKTALSMFAPAREHVKTLYFQWELINLSRQILYLSVPALVVAGVMVAVVEPASFPGKTLTVDNILWIVASAFTFTLLPFLLLTSYIWRLITIAKQTLAVEPLILRESAQ